MTMHADDSYEDKTNKCTQTFKRSFKSSKPPICMLRPLVHFCAQKIISAIYSLKRILYQTFQNLVFYVCALVPEFF